MVHQNAEASGSNLNSPTSPDGQDPFNLTAVASDEMKKEIGLPKNLDGAGKDLLDLRNTVSERTPLLQNAIRIARNPKVYADAKIEAGLQRVLGYLRRYVPDLESAADGAENQSTLLKLILELCILLQHSIPGVFKNAQEQAVVVAPTVSLGQLSTVAMAASTIANMVVNVTGHSIIQGFTSSLDTFISGSVDRRLASLWCQRVALFLAFAIAPIVILWRSSEAILLRLDQEPEVAALASTFLKITALGLPAVAFNEVMKRYLPSQGLSKIQTRAMTAITPLTIFLNYLLVDGPPEYKMGFIGAPVATVICYNAVALLTILGLAFHLRSSLVNSDQVVVITPESRPRFFDGIPKLLKAGAAGVGRAASQGWSKDLGGFAASMFGAKALAAQAVLLVTVSSCHQVPKAVHDASFSRVQKLLLSGDKSRAKIAAVISLVATIFTACMLSNILLASAALWGSLFTQDPLVVQMVTKVLPYIAIFQSVQALGSWVDTMLRTIGKGAVFPALNASTDYAAGIPLGLWLAFWCKWQLAGLWTGLAASTAYSTMIGAILLVRSNWAVDVAHLSENASTDLASESQVPQPAGHTEEDIGI